MTTQPAAFMSYVRLDDEHEGGQLSEFRARLSAEVRMQTGREFPIFQDRNDIAWGQNWRDRIEESLDAVTLLIPVVTPSFFRSPACRDELTRFLDRERELGRGDLVLPVYYIGTPELDDPAVRDADELAKVLAQRQFADWRELRFEPFTAPVVRRALAQLGSRLRDSFWRVPGPAAAVSLTRPARTAGGAAESTVEVAPTARREPPTHVVDPFHRGDFATIGEAVAAARPGDRILVRPGFYPEGLVLEKPLEIIGDGSLADIVVQALGTNVLRFQTNIGRVANMTLRQAGDGDWFGVDISQGRLELEGCDISCQSLTCVAIRNGADPRLRRNRIHDGRQSGVFVWQDGLGLLEDNDIYANNLCGVEIKTGGNPTLRRNQIHDCRQAGVYVHSNGRGILEDNDVHANGFNGVAVREGGRPILRRNRVMRNSRHGIHISEGGGGSFEDNELSGNRRGPWLVEPDCEANVSRARNRET